MFWRIKHRARSRFIRTFGIFALLFLLFWRQRRDYSRCCSRKAAATFALAADVAKPFEARPACFEPTDRRVRHHCKLCLFMILLSTRLLSAKNVGAREAWTIRLESGGSTGVNQQAAAATPKNRCKSKTKETRDSEMIITILHPIPCPLIITEIYDSPVPRPYTLTPKLLSLARD